MRLLARSAVTAAALALVPFVVPAPAPAASVVVYGDLPAVELPAPARPHVTMIGDSTLAGVRWLGSYGEMRGAYDVSVDGESCRRTDFQGCMGRERYAPPSAVEELAIHGSRLGPYVVAMVGYNDGADMFRSGIDRFMAEALQRGVRTVFWLTFRVSVSYRSPNDWSNDGTFRIHNETLADRVPTYGGRLALMDWNAHSATHPEWVHEDGVHLTELGADALMDFVRAELDRALAQPAAVPQVLGVASEPVAGTVGAPGSMVALPPRRLVDTRAGAPVGPQADRVVPVAGREGVPADATGVLVNLTATEAAAPGYATLWPDGEPRPLASTVNVVPGDTRANLAVVPLGAGGALRLWSLTATHYVVDVVGYVRGAPGPVAAGRLLAGPGARLFDSRSGAPLGRGQQVRVPVPQVAAAGGGAAFVTVTSTESAGPGFVTMWPGSGDRPLASTLNTGAGSTRANTTLVPVGPDGTVSVFTSVPTHLVVDLVGVVSGEATPPATTGRLVAASPRRFADSRADTRWVQPHLPSQVRVAGRGGVPADAAGVLANVTTVDAWVPGWVSVWGAGDWPGTSTANADGRDAVAATHVTGLSGGAASLRTSGPMDLVYDVAGWFTP